MEAASLRFGSGRPVRRIEDDALLTGRGRFTDDIIDDETVMPRAGAGGARNRKRST